MAMQSIGPFQLLEELGRGAMGVVFRGFDPAIGRPVAIKIIRADQFASPEEVSDLKLRFAREAASAGKLSHPNIVTVYHLGEEGDLQYLVLELVNGTSLEKTLSDGQPQDPKTATSIIAQVADALDYAHSEGIVHRDVKPANILVRPDGKAKITDFGIARIESHTVTRTGFTFGTPAYMSPEQIMTAKVSGQADQYSLGVIAYQMLSGKKPFDADTGPSLMFQIMETQPALLHAVNPAISPRTSEVIAKTMAKKPEDRYASCAEFAERLSESLKPATAGTRDSHTEVTATMPAVLTPGGGVPTQERTGGERLESATGTGAGTRKRRLGLWSTFRLGRTKIRIAATLATTVLIGVVWLSRSRPPMPAPISVPITAQEGKSRIGKHEPMRSALGAADTKVNAKDGLTYVWIPPGTFQMGCSPEDTECGDNEKPAHQVTITKGFWMGRTEVTQEAWQKVTGTNPSEFNGPRLPVENVSWAEAHNYCQAVGMRLPTEAEWEYAARAGSTGSRYGNLVVIAWYRGNSKGAPHKVGQKPTNSWGLHDTLGNVGEWVEDWFAGQYPPGSATDPKGPASGTLRTLRGGSFFHGPQLTRASGRLGFSPVDHRNIDGVRCAGD